MLKSQEKVVMFMSGSRITATPLSRTRPWNACSAWQLMSQLPALRLFSVKSMFYLSPLGRFMFGLFLSTYPSDVDVFQYTL
jgi:hypothetical protein